MFTIKKPPRKERLTENYQEKTQELGAIGMILPELVAF
jgi:hypothetical protein